MKYKPTFDILEPKTLLSPFTPSQITNAYGLNGMSFNINGHLWPANGTGHIIAIVDAYNDSTALADLQSFDKTFSIPDPPFAVVNFGNSASVQAWSIEEALDVEWAHAMAPGAGIILVEAKSNNANDLLAAANLARNIPLVSVVSMSWATPEFTGNMSYNSYFTTPPGHSGITFVASSGDQGAAGGREWPALAPGVLSVGGTTLNLNSNGGYSGETMWTGSSGGIGVPIVAFDADPSPGVYVTLAGQWYYEGGTSLGAPAWAGIIACADEGRFLTGLGMLDGLSQTIPALFAMPRSNFHSVNSLGSVGAGLGTPNGPGIIYGLAKYK